MRRSTSTVTLAAALLAFGLGAGSCDKGGAPGSQGPTARVDAVFKAYDRADSPGCALGVIKDGRIIYEHGYGMANLELGVPITPASIFDIGSTSKQFAAASIALLEQQGKLSLDDDIRKYVPEIPKYAKPITLRHLLHHTSGLRDYLELMAMAGVRDEDISTDDEALAALARQKETNFAPGEEHLYCNSGFFLMSIVVKRVTGQPLREFARANIFEPLGMRATRFHDDHTKIEPGRATGYEPLDGGGFRIDMSNFEQTGDGSVFTNVEDLALWDANFYEPKVGGRAMLETLQTRGRLNDGTTIDYALGLYLDDYRGLKRVSHGGSWVGYRAELARFPEQHFSVACLCNLGTASPSDLAMKVADIYLADDFAKTAAGAGVPPAGGAPESGAGGRAAGEGAPEGNLPAPTADELAGKAGIYRNPATEEIVTVAVKGSRLRVSRNGETLDFEPSGPGRFREADERETGIAFEEGGAGSARRLVFTPRRGKPQSFEATTPLTLSAPQLAAYAGSYWSDEMQVSYLLRVEGARLALVAPHLPKLSLTPTVRDVFAAEALTLRFERDAASRVKGFKLGAGRIRNVGFARAARGTVPS